MGQLVWFDPVFGGMIYVESIFASGGFVEAAILVGLRQSGELLYFEKGKGDGVPVPGAYTTSFGYEDTGCAIRKADSRVVCWAIASMASSTRRRSDHRPQPPAPRVTLTTVHPR